MKNKMAKKLKTQYPILSVNQAKNLSKSVLDKIIKFNPERSIDENESDKIDAFMVWQRYITALQMQITAQKYIRLIDAQLKSISDINGKNEEGFRTLLGLCNEHRKEAITASENIFITKKELLKYGINV